MSQKTGIKPQRKRREKTKGDKKPNQKRRKDNKTLCQKSERGWEKNLTKRSVRAHELLASTLSYLMLTPW
jgi:hypothetical protein